MDASRYARRFPGVCLHKSWRLCNRTDLCVISCNPPHCAASKQAHEQQDSPCHTQDGPKCAVAVKNAITTTTIVVVIWPIIIVVPVAVIISPAIRRSNWRKQENSQNKDKQPANQPRSSRFHSLESTKPVIHGRFSEIMVACHADGYPRAQAVVPLGMRNVHASSPVKKASLAAGTASATAAVAIVQERDWILLLPVLCPPHHIIASTASTCCSMAIATLCILLQRFMGTAGFDDLIARCCCWSTRLVAMRTFAVHHAILCRCIANRRIYLFP